jgi:hypothetical protein
METIEQILEIEYDSIENGGPLWPSEGVSSRLRAQPR